MLFGVDLLCFTDVGGLFGCLGGWCLWLTFVALGLVGFGWWVVLLSVGTLDDLFLVITIVRLVFCVCCWFVWVWVGGWLLILVWFWVGDWFLVVWGVGG